MKIRRDAKRRFMWEHTAAIRATIYDMLRDGDRTKPSHKCNPKVFNPTAEE